MVRIFFFLFILTSEVSLANSQVRSEAIKAAQAKNFVLASKKWYQLAETATTPAQKQEAQYYLAMALIRLDVPQTASFPLVDLVRSGNGKFQKKALNALVVLAKKIDDKSLLEYSVQRLSPDELSETSRASFYLSLSEIADINGQSAKAIEWAQKAYQLNTKSEESLYQLASLNLASKNEKQALEHFNKLYEIYQDKNVVDKRRGILLMNLARTHYQMKDWDAAANYYRSLPKDHFYYRQSLKELSWTLFRRGKLRSALSPLQSLSTPFYSQFYDPETLLLTGLIHLMSCQPDEVAKVLVQFEKDYIPASGKIEEWMKETRSDEEFYSELVKAQDALQSLRKTGIVQSQGKLPFFLMRSIFEEADIQSHLRDLKRFDAEEKKMAQIFKSGGLLSFASSRLKAQSLATKKEIAKDVQAHLNYYKNDSSQIISQITFLKYEMLDSKKNELKRAVAEAEPVDKDKTRDYYVQNGYRYWPFQGEYWRDEIGSMQYVGQNRCKK